MSKNGHPCSILKEEELKGEKPDQIYCSQGDAGYIKWDGVPMEALH